LALSAASCAMKCSICCTCCETSESFIVPSPLLFPLLLLVPSSLWIAVPASWIAQLLLLCSSSSRSTVARREANNSRSGGRRRRRRTMILYRSHLQVALCTASHA
jgi:hypothetical protein